MLLLLFESTPKRPSLTLHCRRLGVQICMHGSAAEVKRCRRVDVSFNVQHVTETPASCLQLQQSKQIQLLGHQQSGELLQTCFRHKTPASPLPKKTCRTEQPCLNLLAGFKRLCSFLLSKEDAISSRATCCKNYLSWLSMK